MKEGRFGGRAVFLISFAAAMLVIGFMIVLLFLPAAAQKPPPPPPSQSGGVYLPGAQDRLTLFTVMEGKLPGADTFVIAGFYPDSGSLPVAVLPRHLALGQGTLQQLYRKEGLSAAAQALETQYGLSLSRKSVLTRSAAVGVLDLLGPADLHLPFGVSSSDGFSLGAGLHQMDGDALTSVLCADRWAGGEVSRCSLAAELLAQTVNTHLPVFLGSRAEPVFREAVNACTLTDLSYTDFADRLAAAKFMAQLAVSPAQGLSLSGGTDSVGKFQPDEDSLALLRGVFGG